MFILGLTGGIGSGKSAASDYFAKQGVVIVDSDQVARDVVQPGQPAWQAILDRYGNDVLLEDQSLNRAWLRKKVLAAPEARDWLQRQSPPRTRAVTITQLPAATSAYVIFASPLLFERKQSALVPRTLVHDVPEDIEFIRA